MAVGVPRCDPLAGSGPFSLQPEWQAMAGVRPVGVNVGERLIARHEKGRPAILADRGSRFANRPRPYARDEAAKDIYILPQGAAACTSSIRHDALSRAWFGLPCRRSSRCLFLGARRTRALRDQEEVEAATKDGSLLPR